MLLQKGSPLESCPREATKIVELGAPEGLGFGSGTLDFNLGIYDLADDYHCNGGLPHAVFLNQR